MNHVTPGDKQPDVKPFRRHIHTVVQTKRDTVGRLESLKAVTLLLAVV